MQADTACVAPADMHLDDMHCLIYHSSLMTPPLQLGPDVDNARQHLNACSCSVPLGEPQPGRPVPEVLEVSEPLVQRVCTILQHRSLQLSICGGRHVRRLLPWASTWHKASTWHDAAKQLCAGWKD